MEAGMKLLAVVSHGLAVRELMHLHMQSEDH